MYETPRSIKLAAQEMMRSGASWGMVSDKFAVGQKTVYKWLHELQANGEDVAFIRKPAQVKELAVSRLLAGEPDVTISANLGIGTGHIQRWRSELDLRNRASTSNAASRERMKQSAQDSSSSKAANDIAISQLQTALAEKEMELRFFESALREVEARRLQNIDPGEKGSTRR